MPRLIAIDLGASAVKVAVYNVQGKRHELRGRYQEQVPGCESGDSSLGTRLAVLSEMVSRHPEWQQPSSTVVTAWSDAVVRSITLPFTDPVQVEQTLGFAIEGEVPFDLETMVYGHKTVSVTDETELLVVLARNSEVENLINGMSALKLDPRHVWDDCDIFGAYGQPGKMVAVVDFGHHHTEIAVVRDKTTIRGRSVDVGGSHINKAVSDALQCTLLEAEKLKRGNMLPSGEPSFGPDSEAPLPAVAKSEVDSVLALLLAEVRSTLVHAEDSLGVDISEVLLTGGASQQWPLAEYLRRDLQIPVSAPTGMNGETIEPEYAVVDALVMVELKQTEGTEVDLRIGKLSYRGGFDLFRGTLIWGGIGGSLLAAAAVMFLFFQLFTISRETKALEESIRNVIVDTLPHIDPSQVRDVTIAKAIMMEEVQKASARAKVLGENTGVPPTMDALAALSKAFPPANEVTVDVTELTITPDTINFTAETDSYASSDAVEAALVRNERFKLAAKGNEKKIKDMVSFPVTIPLAESEEGI